MNLARHSRTSKLVTWSALTLVAALPACGAPPDEGDGVESRASAVSVKASSWAIMAATNPTSPSYIPGGQNNSSASRKVGTVTRQSAGTYKATFVDLDWFLGANIQVAGVGLGNQRCNVDSWTVDPNGSGQTTVDVSCYDNTGAKSDSEWALSYHHRINGETLDGGFLGGYGYNTKTDGSSSLAGIYDFNSKYNDNRVTYVGTGVYDVFFVGLAAPSSPAGSRGAAMVTRVGGNGYCKLDGWGNSGSNMKVRVRCYSASGSAQNAKFMVSWGNISPLGTPSGAFVLANNATSNFYMPDSATKLAQFHGTPNYDRTALIEARRDPAQNRRYWMHFPGVLAVQRYAAFVVASGSDNKYCKSPNWPGAHSDFPGFLLDPAVYTNCYSPSGAATDSKYSLIYAGEHGNEF